jgi:FtsZ-interacting cell division protein YlmF
MALDIIRLCTTPDEARRCLDHSSGRDTDPYWLEAVTRLAMASTPYEEAEAAQDVSDAVRAHREALAVIPAHEAREARRAQERARERRNAIWWMKRAESGAVLVLPSALRVG